MKLQNKIVSADEAVAVIQDGDTIVVQGFVGIGVPDELILALERRFLTTGHPRGLTLLFAAAPGDGKELGINRLAHDGLFKRVIGSHYALVPKLARMALQNKFEAYNLPSGIDLPFVSRHWRPSSGKFFEGGPSHLCRPEAGWRQA